MICNDSSWCLYIFTSIPKRFALRTRAEFQILLCDQQNLWRFGTNSWLNKLLIREFIQPYTHDNIHFYFFTACTLLFRFFHRQVHIILFLTYQKIKKLDKEQTFQSAPYPAYCFQRVICPPSNSSVLYKNILFLSSLWRRIHGNQISVRRIY